MIRTNDVRTRDSGHNCLHEKYYELVYYINSRERGRISEHDAISMYLDALMSVIRTIEALKEEEIITTNLKKLLMKKIGYLLIDKWRREGGRRDPSAETVQSFERRRPFIVSLDQAREVPDKNPNSLVQLEFSGLLDKLIGILSKTSKYIMLDHLDGFTNEEIAQRHGLANSSTVASLLSQAKKKLRKSYDQDSNKWKIFSA